MLEGLEGLDGPEPLAVAGDALGRVADDPASERAALIGQGLLHAADRAVDGLGAQVLDGAVGDDALTSSVQALNRLERASERTRSKPTQCALRWPPRPSTDGRTRGQATSECECECIPTGAAIRSYPQLGRGDLPS